MMDTSTIVLILQAVGVVAGMIRGYVALIRRLDRIENKLGSCPHVEEKGSNTYNRHGSQPLTTHHL